jgi:hypothetical protein
MASFGSGTVQRANLANASRINLALVVIFYDFLVLCRQL